MTSGFASSDSLYKLPDDSLNHTEITFPDCSIPFSVDDIAKLIVHFDTADMDLPPLIQETSGSKSGR
jgi:hypothetical protein